MVKIDQNKLRRYCADATEAHARLTAGWERLRAARAELARAQNEIIRIHGGEFSAVKKTPDPKIEAQADAALKLAEQRIRLAEQEESRLQTTWEHAARLRSMVLGFARQHNAVPPDLSEEV